MKVAVVGSRGLRVNIAEYIPEDTTEIISGGARGIDSYAEQYAKEHGIPMRIFKPEFALLGKLAFFVRNDQIVDAADIIIAIWDGKSPGTRYTIAQAYKKGKPVEVHIIS